MSLPNSHLSHSIYSRQFNTHNTLSTWKWLLTQVTFIRLYSVSFAIFISLKSLAKQIFSLFLLSSRHCCVSRDKSHFTYMIQAESPEIHLTASTITFTWFNSKTADDSESRSHQIRHPCYNARHLRYCITFRSHRGWRRSDDRWHGEYIHPLTCWWYLSGKKVLVNCLRAIIEFPQVLPWEMAFLFSLSLSCSCSLVADGNAMEKYSTGRGDCPTITGQKASARETEADQKLRSLPLIVIHASPGLLLSHVPSSMLTRDERIIHLNNCDRTIATCALCVYMRIWDVYSSSLVSQGNRNK